MKLSDFKESKNVIKRKLHTLAVYKNDQMSRKYLFILHILSGKYDNIVQLYQYLLENEKWNNFPKEETIMAWCLNIIYVQ